jgi:two-component system cell cycle sensor histidine kinase/response regulator CckA
MPFETAFMTLLILAGAVLMGVSILRFRATLALMRGISRDDYLRIQGVAMVHQALMVFFAIGYLATLASVAAGIRVIGDVVVGLIFFGGALFVLIGIAIQKRMITLIRARLDEAHRYAASLDGERQKLVVINRRLRQEVQNRQQAQTALAESEQRLTKILESLPTGIVIVDAEHKLITEVNPAALKMFGAAKEEVLGAACHRYFCNMQHRACAFDEGAVDEPLPVERELTRRDGGTLPVLKSVRRVLLGGQTCLVESFIDISAQKQLEQRLVQSRKMEAVGALAGGVAHDLNNLLTGITSYPELILMQLPEDSPLREPLQTVKKTGEKAAAVVQDLLTMARRAVKVAKPIQLNTVIADYLDSPEFARLGEAHPRCRIEAVLAEDLPNIMGSPVHMAKCLMNLVQNAAEAMPHGGQIRLTSETANLHRMHHGFEDIPPGLYVALQVADQGVGIAAADQKRIFEPFFTKKEMGKSGTGLGMAVVWGTVKDHGGFVDLVSRPGGGTTITLYVPATCKAVALEAADPAVTDYQGRGQSILVVDDAVEQREIAQAALTQLGYRVACVPDGRAALDHLETHDADLVILDMIMPGGMDGLSTYRAIRRLKPQQRVVIASGYSHSDKVRDAQREGAGAYLQKPYRMANMAQAVHEALQACHKTAGSAN